MDCEAVLRYVGDRRRCAGIASETRRSIAWQSRVTEGDDSGYLAAHSVAESFSTLTGMKQQPRITPLMVQQIQGRLLNRGFQLVTLTEDDYLETIDRLVQFGIVGGVVYDALVARCAVKADAELLITFNERDFSRVHPELAERIITP